MRKPSLTSIACLCLAAVLAGCTGAPVAQQSEQAADTTFQHAIDGPAPWSDQAFDHHADQFQFAVFSDLTGGEREGVFSVAMEQLRLLRPEFVIGVGDLIEGGTEDREQLSTEWDSFDQRVQRSTARVFYVGGNHDLTNPVQWEVWEQRYGPRYYHFVYRDTLFLVLDSEDATAKRQQQIYDSREAAMARVAEEGWGIWGETEYAQTVESHTGTVSAEQSAYFRQVIADHPDVRWTFLFIHKPVWKAENERHFLAIEEALDGRPYTVFNGHNHDYIHTTRRGQDYIQLGTTGGVQLSGKQMAVDHLTLVTVSDSGVDVANLKMSGIFDKSGRIPLNGDALCFEECFPEN